MTHDYYEVPDEGPKKKKRRLPEIAIGLAFGCVGAAGVGYFFLAKAPEPPVRIAAEAPYLAPLGEPGAGQSAGGQSANLALRARSGGSAPVRILAPYQGVVTPASSGETTENCPQVEAVYAAIAEATQGVGITEIISTLSELETNPGGAAGGALAQNLRARLGLSGAATPCGTTLAAVGEALRLARMAAADADLATAEIAENNPPTSFSAIPSGGGAEGSGYTTN